MFFARLGAVSVVACLIFLAEHWRGIAIRGGQKNLKRERSNGIDFSLRHQDSKVRAEMNVFYYDIRILLKSSGEGFGHGLHGPGIKSIFCALSV